MLVKLLQNFGPTRSLVFRMGLPRGEQCANDVESTLKKTDKILDLGTGSGHVCYVLRQRGYNVTPVDVVNLSFSPHVKPKLYDGKKLPYADKSFEVAMVLLVLHHAINPNEIIAEAKRVAKRIVIIEDIYSNRFQKYTTFVLDSVLNLEFFGHPHSNRDDAGWQAEFKRQGLKLQGAQYITSTAGLLHHAIYVLEA